MRSLIIMFKKTSCHCGGAWHYLNLPKSSTEIARFETYDMAEKTAANKGYKTFKIVTSSAAPNTRRALS